MRSCDVIGRVVDGEIYCADCGPKDADPVFAESESDSPNYCPECHERIPENLTTEGVRFVRECIARAIGDGNLHSVALTEWLDLGVDWKYHDRAMARARRNEIRARSIRFLPFGGSR